MKERKDSGLTVYTGLFFCILFLFLGTILGILLEHDFSLKTKIDNRILVRNRLVATEKTSKIKDLLKVEQLLELESQARTLASTFNFIVPIWKRGVDSNDPTRLPPRWDSENSKTGFVVSFRSHSFYLTAAHGDLNSEKFLYGLREKNHNDIESNEIYASEIIDIMIIKLPQEVPWLRPAELYEERLDSKPNFTPVLVVCNNYLHKNSIRTGFIGGLESLSPNQPPTLIVEFPGVGTEPGCSGAPVIGLDGKVRAVILRASVIGGSRGYGVPSSTIIKVINERFFNDKSG